VPKLREKCPRVPILVAGLKVDLREVETTSKEKAEETSATPSVEAESQAIPNLQKQDVEDSKNVEESSPTQSEKEALECIDFEVAEEVTDDLEVFYRECSAMTGEGRN